MCPSNVIAILPRHLLSSRCCFRILLVSIYYSILTATLQSRSFNRGGIFARALVCYTNNIASLTRKRAARRAPLVERAEKAAVLERRCLCPATSLSASRKYSGSPARWEKPAPSSSSLSSSDARYRSLCGRPIKVWIIYIPLPRAAHSRGHIWDISSERI